MCLLVAVASCATWKFGARKEGEGKEEKKKGSRTIDGLEIEERCCGGHSSNLLVSKGGCKGREDKCGEVVEFGVRMARSQ